MYQQTTVPTMNFIKKYRKIVKKYRYHPTKIFLSIHLSHFFMLKKNHISHNFHAFSQSLT